MSTTVQQSRGMWERFHLNRPRNTSENDSFRFCKEVVGGRWMSPTCSHRLRDSSQLPREQPMCFGTYSSVQAKTFRGEITRKSPTSTCVLKLSRIISCFYHVDTNARQITGSQCVNALKTLGTLLRAPLQSNSRDFLTNEWSDSF